MPVVPPLDTDRYFLYQDVAGYMRAVEQAVPHLVRLFTIGSSFEGRPLLLAEVTNRGGHEGLEKPAMWLDGNFHATDLLGSMACLDVLRVLAAGHGRDEFITDLLDHCTFYIVPRVSADGAERCLSCGDIISSSTRPYPFEDVLKGLMPADIDGDGWIRQMRVQHPLGEWKVSRRDPRLLIRREPDDREGPFYRLYREGTVEGSDVGPVEVAGPRFGLDLDRNFPAHWRSDRQQPGSGPFPLSESESRAVADFFRTHPNLFCALSCRSGGGMVQRPCWSGADERLLPEDLGLYRLLGQRITEVADSPCVAAHRALGGFGSFGDWAYEQLGVLVFSTHLWSPGRAAGLDLDDPIRFLRERSESESLALLRWIDRELAGRGFSPWKPFPHPQLGPVEVGGWDLLTTWLNPPPGPYLKQHVERNTRLALALAAAGPRLTVARLEEQAVGWAPVEAVPGGPGLDPPPPTAGKAPLRKIVLEIENRGYLATWVTRQALALGRIPPMELAVEVEPGTELVIGEDYLRLGQLAGTGSLHTTCQDAMLFEGKSDGQRRRMEWLVRGAGEVGFRLRHDRAGFLTTSTRPSSGELTPPPAPPVRAPAVLSPPASVFSSRMVAAPREAAFGGGAGSQGQPARPAATPAVPRARQQAPPPPASQAPPQGRQPTQQPAGQPPPPRRQPAPRPSGQALPTGGQQTSRSTTGHALPHGGRQSPRAPGHALPHGQPSPDRHQVPAGQEPVAQGPFPERRPSGRVLGSPPSKSGPPVVPRTGQGGGDYMSGDQGADLKPLPLVRGDSDFEPLSPPSTAAPAAPKRAGPQPVEPPPSKGPPDVDFPDVPPPRVSRIPAPLLLRRQRGKE